MAARDMGLLSGGDGIRVAWVGCGVVSGWSRGISAVKDPYKGPASFNIC